MRSLALGLVALLFSLALGEVALRVVGYRPRGTTTAAGGDAPDWSAGDPALAWVNRPGIGHPDEPGRVPMTFWPDGQRASAPEPKQSASRRVVLLGCSFTQGFGIADDETFAWDLNQAFPDVRFENWGVGGYGTYQALLLLERLLREPGRTPDLVVYNFIGDHTKRNVASYRWIKSLKSSTALYNVPPRVGVEDGGLATHPSQVVDAWPLERHSAWVVVLHDAWLRWRLRERDRQKEEATNLLLERLDREVREAGSRFAVVLLDDMPPEIREFLDERKVPLVDCSKPSYKTDPQKYRVGGVGHPNGARNALWAECMGRELQARGLL